MPPLAGERVPIAHEYSENFWVRRVVVQLLFPGAVTPVPTSSQEQNARTCRFSLKTASNGISLMTNDAEVDRVWKLMKKIGFCMLSTHDGEDIRARPIQTSFAKKVAGS
jgi:hypothetical protein